MKTYRTRHNEQKRNWSYRDGVIYIYFLIQWLEDYKRFLWKIKCKFAYSVSPGSASSNKNFQEHDNTRVRCTVPKHFVVTTYLLQIIYCAKNWSKEQKRNKSHFALRWKKEIIMRLLCKHFLLNWNVYPVISPFLFSKNRFKFEGEVDVNECKLMFIVLGIRKKIRVWDCKLCSLIYLFNKVAATVISKEWWENRNRKSKAVYW